MVLIMVVIMMIVIRGLVCIGVKGVRVMGGIGEWGW